MDGTAATPSANPADPYGLAPLWDALMEIYDAFAALATKYGWRWYVIGGNALGAIRHNGDFIPWDDDLDLFMPRKDYEEFRQTANDEFPPHLRWVDYHNTASYPYLFGKIVDVRREVHEKLRRETGQAMPQGLFVDIWPLDGCPGTVFRKAWRWLQRQSLRLAMEYRMAKPPMGFRDVARQPLAFLGACMRLRLRTARDFLQAMDAHAKSCSMERAELCGVPIHRWYELNLVCPVETYGEPRWVPFHGRTVPLPHDVERYFQVEFGDWRTLPPIEQRRPVHEGSFEAPWKYGPPGETRGK
ncbi:MAG: LicD family protein [Kiritimatiellae bacterium]|nr:LicD family protein [Kiritimatiellia bacterium]